MAIAVAVLGGALTVGESVRASLRDLVVLRLGNTGQVLSGSTFFREQLAAELGGVPMIALQGFVTAERTGRTANRVQVWGVDERFWRFHGREAHPAAPLASEALARELGLGAGDAVRLSFEQPSAIPLESLHGRKEAAVRVTRVTLAGTLTRDQLGEFSLRPQQGAVRGLFLPLPTLARQLDRRGRVNAALFQTPARTLRERLRLEDVGIRLRPLERGFAVEHESAILSDRLAETVLAVAPGSTPVYTYLANTIRAAGRTIPYALVAATDAAGGVALNEWAARELRAAPGDAVEIEYYLWRPDGRLETASASFELNRILPMSGLGADRALAPEYPGITDSDSVADWDPPFPIDLSRIRPADEEYWKRYRTAPKLFIPLARGQDLWASRFGRLTSIRVERMPVEEFDRRLRAALDPAALGLVLENVREKSLHAASGATDFGEYFTYFSFFLVVAALLLAGLFFRFGVEQRVSEIATLRALGFSQGAIRKLLLSEAAAVAVPAAAVGVAGAVAYAWLIALGLRTWWVDAVGTTLITVHASAAPLVAGAVGGIGMAALFLLGALRSLRRSSPRTLLDVRTRPSRRPVGVGAAAAIAAVLLVAASAGGLMGQTGAFFGAGGLLLAAGLCFEWAWLVRPRRDGVSTLPGLGLRYASRRPGRSVLTIALIAAAAFIIVAVDSFRREGSHESGMLIAESVLPLYLHEDELQTVRFDAFRVRPGEDASCLNLYRPQNPRIIAPPRQYIGRAGNPWPLLDSRPEDGAIPALVDANSLKYVFHQKVGDVIEVTGGARLRFVGTLSDSVFQSDVIVSPENFVRAFPEEQGFRLFLIQAKDEARVAAALEAALADYGFDVVPVRERLAAYHRVENTYLSTFQALGALGLLLGTFGLGAVLLRNVLERRRETALLRAVGYTPGNLRVVLLGESLVLLALGLATGTVPALVAIAPAWIERGGSLPVGSLAALLAAVLAAGLAASALALRFAVRGPLLAGLRAE